jgi:hypothetical protein
MNVFKNKTLINLIKNVIEKVYDVDDLYNITLNACSRLPTCASHQNQIDHEWNNPGVKPPLSTHAVSIKNEVMNLSTQHTNNCAQTLTTVHIDFFVCIRRFVFRLTSSIQRASLFLSFISFFPFFSPLYGKNSKKVGIES